MNKKKHKYNNKNREKMKKTLLFLLSFAMMAGAMAQTQKGFVRTIGRSNDGKKVTGVKRVEGVAIKTEDGKGTMSDKKGNFELRPEKITFVLSQVRLDGYIAIKPEGLPKTYTCSKNELEIVVMNLNEQAEVQRIAESKIRHQLSKQYKDSIQELENLKTRMKITQEEWRTRMQEVYDRQLNDEKLIKEMAERYSRIDFYALDKENRLISQYIIDGKLDEARRLIERKGDINKRIDENRQHREVNIQGKKNLEQSEAFELQEREDIAFDCFNLAETFKLTHQLDSALYYLSKRLEIDSNNYTWLSDIAEFYFQYIGNYDTALQYYENARNIQESVLGENHPDLATMYGNIGTIYSVKGDYDTALLYYTKASKIQECVLGRTHPDLATMYGNIGVTYSFKGDYDTALLYYKKAKAIQESINHPALANLYSNIGVIYADKGDYDTALFYLGKSRKIFELSITPDLATVYNNIGVIYKEKGSYDSALQYYDEAKKIDESILDENHPNLAITYNNIGGVYDSKGDYDNALQYYHKARKIQESVLGEKHIDLATTYSNIGVAYDNKGDYDTALQYLDKARRIHERASGDVHPDLAIMYSNIGGVYGNKGDYDSALQYYDKAMKIQERVLGENHPDLATTYNNIGVAYNNKGDYIEALKYLNMALRIYESKFGAEDKRTLKAKESIEAVKQKMQEQK